jgi:hypothetical protein
METFTDEVLGAAKGACVPICVLIWAEFFCWAVEVGAAT